jgi:SOS response regulatory protein OraA/RecX
MAEYIEKLVDYIKRNIKKGYTEESLKWALINQGYTKSIVERAINKVHQDLSQKAPILKEKPIIRYEILDEKNQPIKIKKPWWKKMLG